MPLLPRIIPGRSDAPNTQLGMTIKVRASEAVVDIAACLQDRRLLLLLLLLVAHAHVHMCIYRRTVLQVYIRSCPENKKQNPKTAADDTSLSCIPTPPSVRLYDTHL